MSLLIDNNIEHAENVTKPLNLFVCMHGHANEVRIYSAEKEENAMRCDAMQCNRFGDWEVFPSYGVSSSATSSGSRSCPSYSIK